MEGKKDRVFFVFRLCIGAFSGDFFSTFFGLYFFALLHQACGVARFTTA